MEIGHTGGTRQEGVGVIAVSELAKKYKTTVTQVIIAAQQQGYIMLCWDDYQNLLDEISNLIGGDEKPLPVVVTGISIMASGSPQEAKVLSKNSSP